MLQVVAEIGLNHNGSEDRAWDLLKSVVDTEVDGVTFQVRENNFYNAEHPRKVELSDDFYRRAVLLAKEKGKEFGIAIAQQEKIDFFQEIGVTFWK